MNATAAKSKPAKLEPPTTSLFAAPVKVAGEAFVVVGTVVGMLVGTMALVIIIILLELIIMLLLMLILAPGIGSIAAAA
jgi:hypothetical protein